MSIWPMLQERAAVLPFLVVEWVVVLTAVRYLGVGPGAKPTMAVIVVRALGATIILATLLAFLWVNRALHAGRPAKLEVPLAVGFIATHLLLVAAILWMIRRREKHRR